MSQQTISIKRDKFGPFTTTNIGTDAMNAMNSIPNVTDVQIITEDDNLVTLSYNLESDGKFFNIEDHLAKFSLKKQPIGPYDIS